MWTFKKSSPPIWVILLLPDQNISCNVFVWVFFAFNNNSTAKPSTIESALHEIVYNALSTAIIEQKETGEFELQIRTVCPLFAPPPEA